MTFQDDRDSERRRKPENETNMPDAKEGRSRKRSLPASDVGDALKTVYQRAVDESIPPEMLDLLGKLD